MLLLTPVEWEEHEGRDRRKWRMSGAEKSVRHRNKGVGRIPELRGTGERGGMKCKLQERVGSGEKKLSIRYKRCFESSSTWHFFQTIFGHFFKF